MKSVETVSEQVKGFVLSKFPAARDRDLKNDEPLLGSGILDSMGILELVTFLEQEFQVIVDDEDLVPENFETIDAVTSFIQSKTVPTSN